MPDQTQSPTPAAVGPETAKTACPRRTGRPQSAPRYSPRTTWLVRGLVTTAAWSSISLIAIGAFLPMASSSSTGIRPALHSLTGGLLFGIDETEAADDLADLDSDDALVDESDLPSTEDLPVDLIEPGDEIVLVLDSGQRIRGELIEKDAWSWTLSVSGIRTTVRHDRVVRSREVHGFSYYYENLKRAIPRNDYGRRLDFAEWIFRQQRFELAAEETELLLDANPNFDEARELLRRINIAMEFAAKREAERAAGSGATREGARGTSDRNRRGNETDVRTETRADGLAGMRLLTRDEINLLRVYEVDMSDPPRMLVDRAAVDALIRDYADSPLIPDTPEGRDRLYQLPAPELLSIMFQLQARELYDKARIIGEPETFRRFNNDVHKAWVIRGCATAECHGGPKGGDLILHNARINDDRVAYTNFLILDRYRLADDDRPLIDVDDPKASPLLQMGLPPHWSTAPHPVVRDWKPVFSSPEDPLFQKTVSWIETLFAPRPQYPVEFEPPHVPDDATTSTSGGGDEMNGRR
ncbi:MAG: hypothetical protein ACOC0P_03995 [Planctomycetota bacterium]